jgi:hypothetical protein
MAPPVPAAEFAGPGADPAAYTIGNVLALQRMVGNGSTARLLARAAAARLDRCPDGSCGGACECEEEEEQAGTGALPTAPPAGHTGKALGGETEYGGAEAAASPLVEGDPGAGVPDTSEAGRPRPERRSNARPRCPPASRTSTPW